MKKKGLIALALAAVMGLSLFACGAETGNEPDDKLPDSGQIGGETGGGTGGETGGGTGGGTGEQPGGETGGGTGETGPVALTAEQTTEYLGKAFSANKALENSTFTFENEVIHTNKQDPTQTLTERHKIETIVKGGAMYCVSSEWIPSVRSRDGEAEDEGSESQQENGYWLTRNICVFEQDEEDDTISKYYDIRYQENGSLNTGNSSWYNCSSVYVKYARDTYAYDYEIVFFMIGLAQTEINGATYRDGVITFDGQIEEGLSGTIDMNENGTGVLTSVRTYEDQGIITYTVTDKYTVTLSDEAQLPEVDLTAIPAGPEAVSDVGCLYALDLIFEDIVYSRVDIGEDFYEFQMCRDDAAEETVLRTNAGAMYELAYATPPQSWSESFRVYFLLADGTKYYVTENSEAEPPLLIEGEFIYADGVYDNIAGAFDVGGTLSVVDGKYVLENEVCKTTILLNAFGTVVGLRAEFKDEPLTVELTFSCAPVIAIPLDGELADAPEYTAPSENE